MISTVCERSVGTVFQLPSPDAIYSQDKEKKRKWAAILLLFGWRTFHLLPAEGVIEGRQRLGQWPSHVTLGPARYSVGVMGMDLPRVLLLQETLDFYGNQGNLRVQ